MTSTKQALFSEFFQTMMQMRKLLDQSIALPTDQRSSTMLQIQAIKHISENQGLTASDLATGLQMSKSAITQLTDRLIDANLILRTPDLDDRRITRFTLTPQGDQHLSTAINSVKTSMGKILDPISAEDLQVIIRIFGDVLTHHNQE